MNCCWVLLSGGAFYTPETIDTARLHYRNSWASILHAEALWLSSMGFGTREDTPEGKAGPVRGSGTAPVPIQNPEDLVKDRLHLLLGNSGTAPLCFLALFLFHAHNRQRSLTVLQASALNSCVSLVPRSPSRMSCHVCMLSARYSTRLLPAHT